VCLTCSAPNPLSLTAFFPPLPPSDTTRPPRAAETPGVHYHFTDQPTFSQLLQDNQFVEHATFSKHSYGTSLSALNSVTATGKICVLDIEMEGVKQIKAHPDIDARFLFVKPPSLEVLEERLRGRGTETEESLRRRLEQAGRELAFAEEGVHDRVVVNDDLEKAYREVEEFMLEE
jgi:guanylate kinase